MSDRLPANIEASAILRRAEAFGGFGAILRKGDPDRGALILLLAQRGVHFACLERSLGPDGQYDWRRAGPGAGSDPAEVGEWTRKRVRFDEDLWLIDLDIADPERFIAETSSSG